MKTSKFGKLQLSILRSAETMKEKGCSLEDVYLLAFPGKEYPHSYLTPILLRMQHQGLIRVDWRLNRVFSKGGKNVQRALAYNT